MRVSWLSYLTKTNMNTRRERSIQSLESTVALVKRSGAHLVIVDNSEKDNDECTRLRDQYAPNVPIFKAANEWRDVSVHYIPFFQARDNQDDHFLYTYDDFVFYGEPNLEDAQRFIEGYDIDCCRIPRYKANDATFNVDFTPKSVNPDSVRHSSDVTHRAQPFTQGDPITIGNSSFLVTNWLPNSRPTVWRTTSFDYIVGTPQHCPTFQQYERLLYNAANAAPGWRSGFIDGGWCYTFPQETSERIATVRQDPIVTLVTLQSAMNDPKRWK